MSGRRRRWVWIVGLLGLALICAFLFIKRNPVDEREARKRATWHFNEVMRGYRIDPHIFKGPERTMPPASRPYGFFWRYSDAQGEVIFYVWVDESGISRVSHTGEITRLRSPQPPR